MARTVYGDPERYRKTYWSDMEGCYFTGDGARQDADGYFWLMGRVDDVINVSGHRLGTMEVESALVAHPKVAEAAVVGRPDELKGQAISAFVSLESGNQPSEELKDELRKWVSKEIGSLARPDDIRFTEALPKTRSGKIMRRLLRELATHGEIKGDITTLEDFTVIAKLREAEEGSPLHSGAGGNRWYPSSASRSLAITVKSSSVVMSPWILAVRSTLSRRRMILPDARLGQGGGKADRGRAGQRADLL